MSDSEVEAIENARKSHEDRSLRQVRSAQREFAPGGNRANARSSSKTSAVGEPPPEADRLGRPSRLR